jgi:hypothetical protein
MRVSHSIKRFTPEQMEILAANPFTYRVTVHRISYTLEFKNIFLSRYESGEPVIETFVNLGYSPAILGGSRMYSFAYKLAKQAAAGEIPAETHLLSTQEKPANVDYNTMPAQQSISAMQREIAYLRQQLEFVKKITEQGKDGKPRK